MLNISKCVKILVIIVVSSMGYSQVSAQETPGYSFFTSDRLGISFEYPSSWTLEEKENRFDTSLEVIVKDGLNAFTVLNTDDTIKDDVESLGFETVVDLLKDSLALQGTLIEDSDFDRYEIDGKQTETFLILPQNGSPQQVFVVNDNGKLITFAYQDSETNFDTSLSQETMENIINSISLFEPRSEEEVVASTNDGVKKLYTDCEGYREHMEYKGISKEVADSDDDAVDQRIKTLELALTIGAVIPSDEEDVKEELACLKAIRADN